MNRTQKHNPLNRGLPFKQGNVLLFSPNQKDLREEHPELNDVEEFLDLEKEELFFVWYYANSTSPFYDTVPIKFKISKCYDAAFLTTGSEAKKNAYLGHEFPSHVRKAIDRMRLFNPEVRFRSLAIAAKIYTEYENIIDEAQQMRKQLVPGSYLTETDAKLRSNYVETTSKILKELPGLTTLLEDGYGLTVTRSENAREEDEEDYWSAMMDRK